MKMEQAKVNTHLKTKTGGLNQINEDGWFFKGTKVVGEEARKWTNA